MKRFLLVLIFFIVVLVVSLPQKAEAKVWTKELVDKVILTSGYKFEICPVSSVQSASDILANFAITKEEEFVWNNPDSVACSGNKEELLVGNTTLFFNQQKWPGSGTAPEQLIVFQDKMYSIQGSGTEMPSGLYSGDEDFIATKPSSKYIKRVGLYPTDPNDFDPNIKDNTIKDAALTIFHDSDGKFKTLLFIFKGQVYKSVAIVKQITEQTTLVDYTKDQVSTPPSPATGSGSMDTTNWQTYTNELFQLKYPDFWDVASDSGKILTIGQRAQNGHEVFLTINTNSASFTDYKSLKLCSQISDIEQNPVICISENGYNQQKPISQIQLGGVPAQSFYLGGGVDYAYHIVQDEKQRVELKMNVAGGGLDNTFSQILSTFKFTIPTPD